MGDRGGVVALVQQEVSQNRQQENSINFIVSLLVHARQERTAQADLLMDSHRKSSQSAGSISASVIHFFLTFESSDARISVSLFWMKSWFCFVFLLFFVCAKSHSVNIVKGSFLLAVFSAIK